MDLLLQRIRTHSHHREEHGRRNDSGAVAESLHLERLTGSYPDFSNFKVGPKWHYFLLMVIPANPSQLAAALPPESQVLKYMSLWWSFSCRTTQEKMEESWSSNVGLE